MAQFSQYPKIPISTSLGQKAMAASLPVVIASDQTAVHAIVDSSALPTGAATSAKQDTGNTSLASLDGKVTACNTGAVVVSSSALPTGASTAANQSTGNTSLASIDGKITACNTGAVVVSSSALPSGAATSAKQPALGTAGTASSDVISVQGVASMTALKVDGSAVTQPVSGTLAATQSGNWSVRAQDGSGNALTSVALGSNRGLHEIALGYASANAPVRNDYESGNVTTSAYTQLVASLTSEAQELEIFDSSGQVLALATGAAASEVNQIYIVPGGNGRIKLRIASGTRVSIKAITATASSGQIIINFYG